jgi:hypothetical protein
MDALATKMAWECADLCYKNLTCTAYLSIGTGPYWCLFKKGDFKLEDVQQFNGTSQCGIIRSL